MSRRPVHPDTLTRPHLPSAVMSEKQLQAAVIQCALWLGWLAYHPYDSRRSAYGYPDCTLVSPGQRRVVWAELKTATGRLRTEQAVWLDGLRAAGQEAYTWRPADWLSGEIERVLRGEEGA